MTKKKNVKNETHYAHAMIRNEERLRKLYETARGNATTEKDISIMKIAYLTGLNRVHVTEEKLANPLFRKSYERGLRFRNLYEYKQKVKIVEEMVNNNIDFDLASDEIKKDQNLRSHYLMYKMKKELEQVRKNKKTK